MMHHNEFVICVTNEARKPYRESNHKRVGGHSSAEIRLPFNSEYEFMCRVRDGDRRRVTFQIDRANAGELILSGNTTHYIERFINDPRKFKFVRAEDGAVIDPDSPDNGKLVVKVYKEQPYTPPQEIIHKHHYHWPSYGWPTYPTWPTKGIVYGSSADSPFISASSPLRGMGSRGLGTPSDAVDSFNSVEGEAGATVEGGFSAQMFGTTTWRGDAGEPDIFTFKVKGYEEPIIAAAKAQFCAACGHPRQPEHKFCVECGSSLPRTAAHV